MTLYHESEKLMKTASCVRACVRLYVPLARVRKLFPSQGAAENCVVVLKSYLIYLCI